MKIAVIAALLASGTGLISGREARADTAAVIERAKLEIQPAVKPFTKVTIDNPLGDVEIIGYDGTSIQIETNKSAPDDEALERLRISLVPNPDGTVRITTTADRDKENKPVKRGAVRIDLKVRAPRGARVETTTNSGRLTMKDMDAGGDLDTASGKIDVQNVSGELSTHTVSGDTSLAKVFGSVDSQSLQADLDLDSITGDKLVASASKGKIAGRRVRSRDITLITTDGKITLEADASLRGRLIVSSLHGNIDIRLHRRGNAIAIRAKGKDVELGIPSTPGAAPDAWVEGKVGKLSNTAAMVEMRSRFGSVQFAIIE